MKHLSTIEVLELIENLCNLLSEKELEVASLTTKCEDLTGKSRWDDVAWNRYIDSSWLGGRLA